MISMIMLIKTVSILTKIVYNIKEVSMYILKNTSVGLIMKTYNTQIDAPIGVFDSGFGGISTLAELLRLLPAEKFIYYADSAHAPYGQRSRDEVRELTMAAAEKLNEQGIKALLVACNTATSAAINELRDVLSIPVIGMEPALKPAAECTSDDQRIAVLATPMTLQENKFRKLLARYGQNHDIEIVPCEKLAAMVEAGHINDTVVFDYITELFAAHNINKKNTSVIVLGCTHYLFVKKTIRQIIGPSPAILDGNYGAARQLQHILETNDLLNTVSCCDDHHVRVTWQTSGNLNDILPRCEYMLDQAMNL